MAEATPPESGSLESMLAREQAEINEMLKNAGQPVEGDDLLGPSVIETQPEPTESKEDLLEKPPAEPEPEPEPTPEPTPEPIKEPEAEKPPVEVKPEPEKKERVPIWKALRDSERRLKDLEAENLRLKAEREQLAKRPVVDEFGIEQQPTEIDEDPLTKVQKEQEKINQRLAQQAEEIRQKTITDTIRSDELRFEKEHPDYNQALLHLVGRARNRFSITGELEDKMQDVLKNNQDAIDRVMTMNGIRQPTDDDVYKTAEDIAFAVLFEQERQRFVQRHVTKGKSVAEAAYELAVSEGWAPTRVQEPTPAAPAPAPAKTESPQERVQRQAKIAAAGQSLSALQNGGPAKGAAVKSKADFIAMAPAEQDKFIAAMEEVDPDWLQKLPD